MSLKSERQRQHKQEVEERKRRQRRRQRFPENQENQEYVLVHVFDPQTGYYSTKYITKKEKESLILVYVR